MSKEFNWSAFNKVLQGSKNICSDAKADIARAIKAGSNRTTNEPQPGEVWLYRGRAVLVQLFPNSGEIFAADLTEPTAWDAACFRESRVAGDFTYAAGSLKYYLASGGAL